jgi:hypothetical protein
LAQERGGGDRGAGADRGAAARAEYAFVEDAGARRGAEGGVGERRGGGGRSGDGDGDGDGERERGRGELAAGGDGERERGGGEFAADIKCDRDDGSQERPTPKAPCATTRSIRCRTAWTRKKRNTCIDPESSAWTRSDVREGTVIMIRFKPRHILAPLLVSALFITGSSAAQPKPGAATPTGVEALAGELFDKGNVFYKQSRWAEAEVQFQKAWDVRRGFDIAANLGDCELQIGQVREAAEHLAYAIREFPLSGKTALRERLQKRFAEAREQVGILKVSADAEGAELVIDGLVVGRSPLSSEVFVDPGVHAVEARLTGYEEARASLEVPKGSSKEVRLVLEKKIAPPPPPLPSSTIGAPIAPPPPGGPSKPILISGGATAGVGVVAGVIFTVLANGKAKSARDATQSLVATTWRPNDVHSNFGDSGFVRL